MLLTFLDARSLMCAMCKWKSDDRVLVPTCYATWALGVKTRRRKCMRVYYAMISSPLCCSFSVHRCIVRFYVFCCVCACICALTSGCLCTRTHRRRCRRAFTHSARIIIRTLMSSVCVNTHSLQHRRTNEANARQRRRELFRMRIINCEHPSAHTII